LGQVREDWLCGIHVPWNDGILGMAECYLFLSEWHGSENKIGHNSLLIPKIPLFSPIRRLYEPEAIIPWII